VRRSLTGRARPEAAFESLYRRHAGDVYRYARTLLGDPIDAEDVTQAAFLNAYRALLRGERPDKPGNWLRAIAHNICRQRFRQAARRPRELPLDEDVAQLIGDEQAPTLEDLTRALKHIPFNQRAALVLREFEGRSSRDIAAILGVSPASVESLLFRARRSLREQLESSLTCPEAEHVISKRLDGHLSRTERGALRAHLRQCPECAHLARSLRAQRSALKALAALPVPGWLASSFQLGAGSAAGGLAGGTTVAGSLGAKLVATTAAATILAGVGYEGVAHQPWRSGGTSQRHVAGKRLVPTTATAPRFAFAVPSPTLEATPTVHADAAATRPDAGRAKGRRRHSVGAPHKTLEKAVKERPPKPLKRGRERREEEGSKALGEKPVKTRESRKNGNTEQPKPERAKTDSDKGAQLGFVVRGRMRVTRGTRD
jgi:RNA polymerase sigma factor (sigma-70 family)